MSTQQTTIVSTQPTSVVSTQVATQTLGNYGYNAVPSCSSSMSGQTYQAGDGSQYMMLCGQSNSGPKLYGVTAPANSYGACIDRCANQGTDCTGITWQASSSQCILKSGMQLARPDSTGIDTAVRLTGSGGVRSLKLTNGAFFSKELKL